MSDDIEYYPLIDKKTGKDIGGGYHWYAGERLNSTKMDKMKHLLKFLMMNDRTSRDAKFMFRLAGLLSGLKEEQLEWIVREHEKLVRDNGSNDEAFIRGRNKIIDKIREFAIENMAHSLDRRKKITKAKSKRKICKCKK